MLTYDELKEKASRFVSLTGIRVDEFEALLPSFQKAWEADVADRAASKPRKRKAGGGRNAILVGDEERLLFILVYIKVYPLQEVQGELFGMSQSRANAWLQRLTPILQQALAQEKFLPERDPLKLEEVLLAYDWLEFAIDGTERRRQRPVDASQQKELYSGKKKRIRSKTT